MTFSLLSCMCAVGMPRMSRWFLPADGILGCFGMFWDVFVLKRACSRITKDSFCRKSSFGCHELFRERSVCCILNKKIDFDPYLRHVHFRWASSLNRIASVEPPNTTTYIYSHAMVCLSLCLSDVGLAPTCQVPLQCAFIFFRRLLLYHCLQTRFYLQFGMEMELF